MVPNNEDMTPKLAKLWVVDSHKLAENTPPQTESSQANAAASLQNGRIPIETSQTPPTTPQRGGTREQSFRVLTNTAVVTPLILTPPDTPTVVRGSKANLDLGASDQFQSRPLEKEIPQSPSILYFSPNPANDYVWSFDSETGRVDLPICGVGGWSTVYKSAPAQLPRNVTSPDTNEMKCQTYAVKVYSRRDSEARAVLRTEALILSHLTSLPTTKPHIIPFYGLDERRNALVLEYVPSSLQEYIQRHGRLSLAPWWQVASQLLHGLAAIHAANVVHADVKPSNIILLPIPRLPTCAGDPEWTCVYSDFSSSHLELSDVPEIKSSGNTYEYMAPELFSSGRPVRETKQSDIFALGVTLLFAALGQSPYRGMHRMQVIGMARAGKVLQCVDITTSQDSTAMKDAKVRALMERMVANKAEERWSAEKLCEFLKKEMGC